MEALQQQVAQLAQALQETRSAVEQKDREIQQLKAAVTTVGTGVQESQEKMLEAVTKNRDNRFSALIPKPKTFTGQKEAWEAWRFTFESWIQSIDSDLYDLMLEHCRDEDEIDIELLKDADKVHARQLQSLLVAYSDKEALVLCKGVRDGNGLETWRRLHRDFESTSKLKGVSWRRTLLSPTFPRSRRIGASPSMNGRIKLPPTSRNSRKPWMMTTSLEHCSR